MSSAEQARIDLANEAFWDNLCGSHLAEMIGVTDDGPESLAKYDAWFFDLYPYLLDHVPVRDFGGQQVLEVGLGYGSLGQKIAEATNGYFGMDIARGPAAMMRHRLALAALPGDAAQRSFLENQLPDASFDRVVAIGCFHHTGDIQRCFDETWRLLRSGGHAHVMVYNRYSHRRWLQNRRTFVRELVLERLGLLRLASAARAERAANDRTVEGEAAPETVFVSVGELKRRLRRFSSVSVTKENMDDSDDPKWDRKAVLPTWGRRMGLDLYVTARK